ncbi:MAG: aspartate/glutamate racemase family protein, partial [Burkholderiales bacterium]
MTDKILVINPNSTEAVTRGIDEGVAPLRIAGGPAIDCVTLADGPPGIETQQHVDSVVAPLLKLIRKEEIQYAAFVIACYSDPGLHSLREATKKPVLGISECGILTALTLGQKFGVIAILKQSIPRHLRYV